MSGAKIWAALVVAISAYATVSADELPTLAITEIHYNPTEGDQLEFIELRNTTAATIDLSGWAFTQGVRFEFPVGVQVEAGSYLVACRNSEAIAELHGIPESRLVRWFTSGLDNGGETIELVDAEGVIVDEVRFDDDAPWDHRADAQGFSLQRRCETFDASAPNNWIAADPTPLAANGESICPPPALAAPSLAISEIYYHPLLDQDARYEYVELTNASDADIDLEGICFSQGITYCFEAGRSLAPGEILVVARDLEAAKIEFGIENIVGPFEGELSNNGERVTLVDHRGGLIDSVRYSDRGDWPVGADGLGYSLEKMVLDATTDDPASWTDGSDSQLVGWQELILTGRGTGDYVQVYLNAAGELLVDDLSLVDMANPDVELLSNGSFDEGLADWDIRGNHENSIWTNDLPDREERGLEEQACLVVSDGRGSSSNSIRLATSIDLDRSGDTTYRFKLRYRHVSGSDSVTIRNGGASPSRGMYYRSATGPVISPGRSNFSARATIPPFVSNVGRFPQQPTSTDATRITALVRGDVESVQATVSFPYDTEAENLVLPMADDGKSGDVEAGDGIYAVTIPPQAHNTVVLFSIEAIGAVEQRTFPSEADPVGGYGYYVNDDQPESQVPVWHVILSPTLARREPRAAIAALNCSTYAPVSFSVNGDLFYNIGIRRRGQSVCGDGDVIKKYLKIRFHTGYEHLGARKFNLQSLWTDKSLIRERMAWEVFDEFGSPNCTHDFVRLHVQGEYFGLYAAMEHLDHRYLRRNDLNPDGNLYKAVASREERTGSRATVQQSYEKKTNEEDPSFADLSEFLSDLHTTPRAGLVEFFNERTDADEIIDYQAGQVIANNRDYPHKNHYLYHDTARGKWMPIAWDMDLVFGKRWDGNNEGVLNDLMDSPGTTIWHTTSVRGGGAANHLLDKFFAQSGTHFRRAYLVRLWGMIHEKYTPEFWEQRIVDIASMINEEQLLDIAEWGRSRPSPNDRNAPAEFEPNLDRVRAHIRTRRNYLVNFLRNTERFAGYDRLKITELMYNPVGEDDGEFIELWNNSGHRIDISGWSVGGVEFVDANGNRTDYLFPDGTLVDDGEVIVLAKSPDFHRARGFKGRLFGPYPGFLSNSGESLRVRDDGPGHPATVDRLEYSSGGDWPPRPDGLGYSLELTDVEPNRDNDFVSAWRESTVIGGTPGVLPRAASEVLFSRGDCNADGRGNISDAVEILLHLFSGGRDLSCIQACDINGDEGLNLTDAIAMLNFLFSPDGFDVPSPGPGEECQFALEGLCETSNCAVPAQ